MSPTAVPPTPVSDDDDFNFTAAKNNRDLIEKRFGRTITQAFLHAPYALRRSVMADLEAEYPDEFRSTAASRMRSRTDHSIPSSLHHYFGFFTERCVPGRISCGFVNVGLREHHTRLTRLLSARPHDVFCLNDYHDGDVPDQEQHRIIHAFLESYFPVASSFEKGSPQNLKLPR
jgi:Stealth-like protein